MCQSLETMLNNLHFFPKERENSRRICLKTGSVLLKRMSIREERIMSRGVCSRWREFWQGKDGGISSRRTSLEVVTVAWVRDYGSLSEAVELE